MELKIEQVSKKYGKVRAVNQMNTTLTSGIIGLLGANGSGKTTLLRMLVSVLSPDEGTITYNGIDILTNRDQYLSGIGYMPQHLGMYPNFRVDEFLQYMGAVKGLTKEYTNKRIEELLPLVHLENEVKKKIKALSGGMRQRLGIAQALLNDPSLLIMDEPTAGLDPKERNQFSRLLANLSRDKIILISTHIVSDVEAIADEIMIMKKGDLIAKNTPQKLLEVLANKVKESIVSKEEFFTLQKQYVIVHQKEVKEGILIRYLDMENTVTGTVVDASLNDLYLYYFAEEER